MADRTKNKSGFISKRIRELRLEHGLTQKELSLLINKSESTVRMWELGKSEPDIQTIRMLSEIFSISTDYIISEVQSSVPPKSTDKTARPLTIGDRIRLLRKESGMSQEDLAILLNITKQAVYKYESGIVTNIPIDKIEVLSKIFNVSPGFIAGWREELSDNINSNDLPKKIYILRRKHNLTLEQVADIVGVGKSTVRKWETGMIANMRRDKIALLAKALHTTPAYLMGWAENEYTEKAGVALPVYGSVAAGIPIEAITDIEDYEEIPESLARTGQFAALKIKGDSMEPKFSNGDVVIVKLQDTVENGDIAVVLVNGDEATCKKIKKTPEGVMLISTNPAYEPMFYSNREIDEKPVRIWGKVVELRAKF
ncbi:MAG: helix-turn-helix domain-containing protein [Clostridia bacterium]|nr:helix-turn-helix domain-containing protein [Clostridia bacterium]